MKSAPNLDVQRLSMVIRKEWGLPPHTLSYLPVGFGSHHWLAEAESRSGRRWFVTVDEHHVDSASWSALDRAMRTARHLQSLGELEFVVGPTPTQHGKLLASLDDRRWSVMLFPFLDVIGVEGGAFASRKALEETQRMVARLHAVCPDHAPWDPPRFDFSISGRFGFELAMQRVDREWNTGPFGEPSRSLLLQHRSAIERSFRDYDRLAMTVGSSESPWVITHGEPHAGNALARQGSGMVMVDWDTVALAPRERDLWQLMPAGADPEQALAAYRETLRQGGSWPPSPHAMQLFRLHWDLTEVTGYVEWFRHSHVDSDDMREGWSDLVHSVEALVRRS